jgi:DNA-binding MarR family transcriptional regulator
MLEARPSKTHGVTLVAQVAKLHRQRADDLLNEIGLHVGQEMMLRALWDRGGVAQTELAREFGVQLATVTNARRRLERNGIVKRAPDAADQRVSLVFLTNEGRERRAAVEEKWSRLERESFAGLSGSEQELIRDLLSRVHHNLSTRNPGQPFPATVPMNYLGRPSPLCAMMFF